MSHAELRLSRQKVAHLETMPLFLGILNGEVLAGRSLGTVLLPCCTAASCLAVKHAHPCKAHT